MITINCQMEPPYKLHYNVLCGIYILLKSPLMTLKTMWKLFLKYSVVKL